MTSIKNLPEYSCILLFWAFTSHYKCLKICISRLFLQWYKMERIYSIQSFFHMIYVLKCLFSLIVIFPCRHIFISFKNKNETYISKWILNNFIYDEIVFSCPKYIQPIHLLLTFNVNKNMKLLQKLWKNWKLSNYQTFDRR